MTFEFAPFAGGIATYSHQMAAGLARLGCRVRVLAPSYLEGGWDDGAQVYETVRMDVEHGGPELMRFVTGAKALTRQIEDFGPDVALLTSDLAHGVGGWICRRKKVPYVAVVHGSEIKKHFPPRSMKRWLQSLWLRSAYERAGAVFCVSGFVKELMLEAGFDPETLAVIHNGVDDAVVETPRNEERIAALRAGYRLEDKRVALTIARLVARKGQAAMIRAMSEILAHDAQIRYVVAGDGEDAARLRQTAQEAGVEEAVVFAGKIPEEDKVSWIDLCDVYVLASSGDGERVEGLGIALLEAAARGKPLVGGHHGGVPEIIDDGVNGYLVDPARPAALARAVIDVLESPSRARALGEASLAKLRQSFLASRMCSESKRRMEAVVAQSS